MKAQLIDHIGCFEIHLIAETMEEAKTIALFGANKTKELRSSFAWINDESAEFQANVVIGAKKDRTTALE